MCSKDIINMFNFVFFNSFNSAVSKGHGNLLQKAASIPPTFSNSSPEDMLDHALLWWSIGTQDLSGQQVGRRQLEVNTTGMVNLCKS